MTDQPDLHFYRHQVMSLDEYLEIVITNEVVDQDMIISERNWDLYLKKKIKEKKTVDFWKDYVSLYYVIRQCKLPKEVTIDIARRTRIILFRHRQHPYIRKTDIDKLIRLLSKKRKRAPEYTRPLEEYQVHIPESGK